MWFFIVGIATGLLSGMGIGGGTILIPTLIVFMKMDQHSAQCINLLSFIPSAIIALIIHNKNKNIEKSITKKIFLPGILAALLGSYIATNLGSFFLKKLFGIFLLLMGIFEIISQYIL